MAPESQLVLTAVVSVVVVYVAVATTVATAAAQSEVTFVVRARGTGSVPSVAVVASVVVAAATVAVAEVFAESVASWHRPAAAARQFDELAMSSPRSASVSATPVAGQLTVAGRS